MLKKRMSSMNIPMYKVEKTANTSGILLHEHELDLLEFLFRFNPIRSIEFLDYANYLRCKNGFSGTTGELQQRNNTAQRLTKLNKAGLIQSVSADSLKGYKFLYKTFFYQITRKSLDVLHAANRIDETTYKKHCGYMRRKGTDFQTPSLHSIAVTKVAVDLQIRLLDHYKPSEFEVAKGSKNKVFVQKKVLKDNVVPDLTVNLPSNRILAIEVDGGKQSKDVIVEKYLKYKELFSEDKQNASMQLVFVSMDDDMLEGEGIGNKLARTKKLKEFIPQFTSWSNELNVFVFRYKDFFQYIDKAIAYLELPLDEVVSNFLGMWLFNFKIVLNDYEVTTHSEQELLQKVKPSAYSPHLVLGVRQTNKRKRYYFVYYMLGGYVKSWQLFKEATERVAAINDGDTYPFEIRILLVYQYRTEREQDLLDMYMDDSELQVIGTSVEEWTEIAQQSKKEPLPIPLYVLHQRLYNFSVRKENYKI